jgi:hypothetical protein
MKTLLAGLVTVLLLAAVARAFESDGRTEDREAIRKTELDYRLHRT